MRKSLPAASDAPGPGVRLPVLGFSSRPAGKGLLVAAGRCRPQGHRWQLRYRCAGVRQARLARTGAPGASR